MPCRLRRLRVRNFRSIEGTLDVTFPDSLPVVLVGENNAGKSNIVKALDLVLGHMWPGSREPEDNDFYLRDREKKISILAEFAEDGLFGRGYDKVYWRYDASQTEPIFFRAKPGLSGYEFGYISNEDRSSLSCIVIEAERNLTYQLSYASKYTLLSRLMQRFHKAMTEDEDTKSELLRLFGEVRLRFNSIQPFVDFTNVLQTRLGEFSGNMSHRLEVDFEAYNPINFFHALRLQAAEGSERRALTEMGTGEQQILALSLAYAYAAAFHEGMLLVIEEPEAHLHPLAQQWLARRLHTLAESGLQLLITTHSSHFIELLSLPGVVLVGKGPSGTTAVQRSSSELASICVASGADSGRTREENILSYYGAVATPEILEGFFARAVVLVEGRTEALALPELWRRISFEHAQLGVAVVPVGGKGNLAKWKRLFEGYQIPCYVVLDNDPEDDRTTSKRRDALSSLRVSTEAQDGLLTSSDWLVESNFALFGADFERTLRDFFPQYSALEEQARGSGIETKPFVARWVAQRLPLDQSVGRSRLEAMVGAIRALNSAPV